MSISSALGGLVYGSRTGTCRSAGIRSATLGLMAAGLAGLAAALAALGVRLLVQHRSVMMAPPSSFSPC